MHLQLSYEDKSLNYGLELFPLEEYLGRSCDFQTMAFE